MAIYNEIIWPYYDWLVRAGNCMN